MTVSHISKNSTISSDHDDFVFQFHGCPVSDSSLVQVSGLTGSQTLNTKQIVVRGSGILNLGIFNGGMLSLYMWSRREPFQELAFEFDLLNPTRQQAPRDIYVSISSPNAVISATKAAGKVLGSSNPPITAASGAVQASQVILKA